MHSTQLLRLAGALALLMFGANHAAALSSLRASTPDTLEPTTWQDALADEQEEELVFAEVPS